MSKISWNIKVQIVFVFLFFFIPLPMIRNMFPNFLSTKIFYLHKTAMQMNINSNLNEKYCCDLLIAIISLFSECHWISLWCFLFLLFTLKLTDLLFFLLQIQIHRTLYQNPLQNVELTQRSYKVVGSKIHLYYL